MTLVKLITDTKPNVPGLAEDHSARAAARLAAGAGAVPAHGVPPRLPRHAGPRLPGG